MIKKVNAVIGIICLTAILTICPVLAEAGDMSMTLTYDGITDSVTVSGEITDSKGNIPLLLELKLGDDVKDAMMTVAGTPENGKVSYKFDPIMFPTDAQSGRYTVTVSAQYVGIYKDEIFEYTGADLMLNAIKKLNAAIADGSEEKITAELEETAGDLNVNFEDFSTLNEDLGAKTFYKLIKAKSYIVPDTINSVDDQIKIKNAVSDFCKDYADYIMIASFRDIKSAESMIKWYDRYFAAYQMEKDDVETLCDESKMFHYLEKEIDSPVLAERVSKIPECLTPKDIKDKLYEAALLASVKDRNITVVKEMITSFPELFPLDDYSGISQVKLGKIFEDIAGKNFETYDSVTSKFNGLLSGYLNGGGNGGGAGRGNSSGGGNIYISGSYGNDDNNSDNNMVFEDLTDSHWAFEAVKYLHSLKIVNGRTEKFFEPNGNITRAEFSKLLVSALKIPLGNDSALSYIDISAGEWYVPYISAASSKGIVQGSDGNRFNPDSPISRQDMSVMICRAYGLNDSDSLPSFDDSADIADYAKTAVTVLNKKGIINGVGNNLFDPNANATRAQAAQIIYKLLLNN